jgi:uncharacterized membrane protein
MSGRHSNGSNWLGDTLGNRPFIVAVLYLASFFLPVLLLVAVPLAFIFRREPGGEWEMSHYRYLARTFGIALALCVVIAALAVAAFIALGSDEEFGLPVLLVAGLAVMAALGQFGIRSVLSMARAAAREPMPNPTTLLF